MLLLSSIFWIDLEIAVKRFQSIMEKKFASACPHRRLSSHSHQHISDVGVAMYWTGGVRRHSKLTGKMSVIMVIIR